MVHYILYRVLLHCTVFSDKASSERQTIDASSIDPHERHVESDRDAGSRIVQNVERQNSRDRQNVCNASVPC